MNRPRVVVGLIGVVLFGLLAWVVNGLRLRSAHHEIGEGVTASTMTPSAFVPPTPLQLILVPEPGKNATELDKQIAHYQAELRPLGGRPSVRLAALDTLGWLFVTKARTAYDPGYNKLAEQSALEMEAEQPGSPEAWLLRGHVLHQFHRFKEAEALARKLVAVRGSTADYALLGDSLMEQGQLEEAGGAYQNMLDLRPDFESYVRAAHFRWLKGELPGARDLMVKALGVVDRRDVSTLAWAEQRLALYDLQAGDLPAAQQDAEAGLQAKPGDAAASLALGRVLSAEGKEDEALVHFRIAAEANPLPDYLWQLSDHLEARGLVAEAAPIKQTLRRTGQRADPRTFALYLATTGQDPTTAQRLSEAELDSRRDVLSWDALAWSQLASGQVAAARESMQRALAEGTQDGRLFLHAAAIAAAAHDADGKRVYLQKADALEGMLLPSERRLLDGLSAPGERRAAR